MFQRSQDALSKLAKQISARENEVLKTITKTQDIKKQFTKFEGVLKKCR